MNSKITIIEYWDKSGGIDEKYVLLSEYAALAEYAARIEGTLRIIADLKHHEVISGHDSWQQLARDALKDTTVKRQWSKE